MSNVSAWVHMPIEYFLEGQPLHLGGGDAILPNFPGYQWRLVSVIGAAYLEPMTEESER